MVVSTYKELISKKSKKQHQILAQTAYYQAGKIVIQTILPEQPPVALITLNTLGTTCSTSADTYIPIEDISNTQSCSFLESRLVSLYGGKAASLLIEYQQRLSLPEKVGVIDEVDRFIEMTCGVNIFANDIVDATSIYVNKEPTSYFNQLINNVQNWVLDPPKLTPFQTSLTKDETKGLSLAYCKACLTKTYFAGAGNNIFQSTLGNREIQTATRLASIMVNYWNFYSLNKKTALIGSPLAKHGLSLVKKRTQRKTPSSLTSCPKEMLTKEVQNISTYEAKKASSKAGLSPIPKSNGLVNSYLFERNQSQALFVMQSRGFSDEVNRLNRAVSSKPIDFVNKSLSFAASQVYYSASFTDAFANKIKLGSAFSKEWAQQLVGVKNRRGSLSKGFEEIAEGYKPQPATDSSVNEINRSVKVTPLLSHLFTSKQYKALRLCIDRVRMGEPPWDAKALPLISFAYPKGLAKLSQESGVEKQGVAAKRRVVRSKEEVKQSRPLLAPTFHYNKYNGKVLAIKSKGGVGSLSKDKTSKVFAFRGFYREPCRKVWANISSQGVASQGQDLYYVKPSETKDAKLKETSKCKDLHFAIMQSKNSLKICENKNLSYNIRRFSVENIGGYSQLNNNNFQLINSLQFSNLQRDRFYPNWFRLYLPDIEATEFLKNVANYYFSLGLQTFTLPSTKLNPFSTFLNKYTLNPGGFYSSCSLLQRSINTSYDNLLTNCASSINYASSLTSSMSEAQGVKQRLCITDAVGSPLDAKCEEVESLGGWVSTARSKRAFTTKENKNCGGITNEVKESVILDLSIAEVAHSFASLGIKALWGTRGLRSWKSVTEKQRRGHLKVRDSSCRKIAKDQLDTAFSLLVENQIFPLNYNDFSIVEKELLYDTLVNSCFAKAFYLINQNRQLLDFLVDYLLRFQILRQHQILYLFSTLLVSCNKSQIPLANF